MELILVYLHDIVIISGSLETSLKNMRHVLTLPNIAVTINLKMYGIFSNTISSLCHVIHPRQLEKSKHTIDAIGNLKHKRVQWKPDSSCIFVISFDVL